jgi:hypothetical protein
MSHLITKENFQHKVASLKSADAIGKSAAQFVANQELAKLAGRILSGQLDQKTWGMTKEAGVFKNVVKGVGSVARRVGSTLKSIPGTLVNKAIGAPGKVVPKLVPAPAILEGGQAEKFRSRYSKPITVPKERSGAGMGPKLVPAPAILEGGQAEKFRSRYSKPELASIPKERSGAGMGPKPITVPKERSGAGMGPRIAPPSTPPSTPQGASPANKGSMGWGKALPWMAGGGLAYGLMKGVPWAARQLEQSQGQNMSPSLGWSPVPYGYGHTPYGPGTENMGSGS